MKTLKSIMQPETTTIEAKQDLYNSGRCFTKGKRYEVNGHITMTASLMERQVVNDLGEKHLIGSWWREFKIVNE